VIVQSLWTLRENELREKRPPTVDSGVEWRPTTSPKELIRHMSEPRNGEHVVNTHTGENKPDGEPFNGNSHGHRCYHGADVGAAIEHWGTFNGRVTDKRTSLELVEALVPKVGDIFEVFHIERYVAVTFAGTPATIETYISTGFVETRTKVLSNQVKTGEGLWRLELSGLGRNSPGGATRSAIRESECPCSPGMKVPVGSSCPTCEEPIVQASS
jgi:hypothetical protein